MSDFRKIQISEPVFGEEEWQAVREPLLSGWVTQGPKVAEFERIFAARHEVPHALAVTSCTTGLHLALVGLGVGAGDEVIVPAFTWAATANVVVHCGAKPVFVDVDPRTFNIDPKQISAKVTERTKAVIVVHLFGLPAAMDEIAKAAPGIPLIEDAACATGAALRGVPAGGLGTVAAFSFHPRKSVTTGEGGMVTTKDPELAERMNRLRNHGASLSEEQRHRGAKPYLLPDFDLCGFNYRMTDLQAAVGIVQLGKLDKFLSERRERAKFYQEELSSIPWLRVPTTPADALHGWQAFVTFVDPERAPAPRNDLMDRLQGMGVSTRPGTHAVHMLGYYRENYGLKPEDFPGARDSDRQSLAIPLHNKMSDDDYRYVVRRLKELG